MLYYWCRLRVRSQCFGTGRFLFKNFAVVEPAQHYLPIEVGDLAYSIVQLLLAILSAKQVECSSARKRMTLPACFLDDDQLSCVYCKKASYQRFDFDPDTHNGFLAQTSGAMKLHA